YGVIVTRSCELPHLGPDILIEPGIAACHEGGAIDQIELDEPLSLLVLAIDPGLLGIAAVLAWTTRRALTGHDTHAVEQFDLGSGEQPGQPFRRVPVHDQNLL